MASTKGKLIAFVSTNAWTMYNFRMEVLQAFLSGGYRVLVIAEEDDYTPKLEAMGCEFLPLQIRNRFITPLHDLQLFLHLRTTYRTRRPDLIFHYVAKPNIYGSIAAGWLNIPSIAVITGLGYAFNRNDLLRYLIKQLYRFALRSAAEVWCLNKEGAELLVHEHVVPIQKIKVLSGEGVDTDYFAPAAFPHQADQPFTFLLCARLLKSKGILEYADAALILKKKNYRFQCLLLGAVEQHPDAIESGQIKEWEHERGLTYLGFTGDVRPYLAQADCFVYPSYYNEGVPRSLLEACSMELPVITTDNTGCRELVKPGESGLVCRMKDRFELAARMEEMLLMDPARRKRMGKEGRLIVEAAYGTKQVLQQYEAAIKQFLR